MKTAENNTIIHLQGYQFPLRPKPKHLAHLRGSMGANRFLWNKLLAMNLYRLKNKLPIIWYNEMAWWIGFWKHSEEYAFLKEAPSQSLQQTAKALDRAFREAFDKKNPKRIPVFKKKSTSECSIRYPQHCDIDENNQVIKFPKMGWVRYRRTCRIQGTIKNITISYKAGAYTVSIQVERVVPKPVHASNTAVGIDVGVAQFATCSNGDVLPAPVKRYNALSVAIAQEQVRLARMEKRSAHATVQKTIISRLYQRRTRVCHDFLHKTSTRFCKNHALIVVEDLKIGNMTRSAKGTLENPGKRVAQKTGLNRSILAQSWGELFRQLTYKQRWAGGWVIAVPPHHTSQTCPVPACGHVSADNRKTQAEFLCVSCGYANNADHVGAINILDKGLKIFAVKQPQDYAGLACQVSGQ